MRAKTESQISRKSWIVVAVLAFAAILLVLFFDTPAFAWINAHSSGSLKHGADFVSRIGDWPSHVVAGLVGMALGWWARRKDWLRIFLAMLIACALAGIAARAIKVVTGRARPLVKSETVWNGPRLSASYNAFPSGHTASSTAFFFTLFLARKRIGAPLLLIPVIIGAARIFSGAHYLSDVTFAAALGIACAILSMQLRLPVPSAGEG